jgi:pyruvate dehydrogenase E2 component (dihydrolipoamide acetyltransferase)
MRQTIAAAMSRSKREIPHYYLAEEVEFERAAAWLAARRERDPRRDPMTIYELHAGSWQRGEDGLDGDVGSEALADAAGVDDGTGRELDDAVLAVDEDLANIGAQCAARRQ